MKSYNDIFQYLFDVVPFRRRTSTDWILPASIGLGLGVAAGVGIGMLFAPATGEETRRQLKDASYRMKEKAMNAATEAKERVTHQLANRGASANHIGESSYVNDMGDIR